MPGIIRHALTAFAALATGAALSVHAGEIIVSPAPEAVDSAPSNAEIQKQRARAFRKERNAHPDNKGQTIILIPGDSDEGMLSPGRNSADSPAAEARQHAVEVRKPEAQRDATILLVPPQGLENETNAERAHDNRMKARAYSKQRGDRPLGVGRDGIPYVDCSDAGSVSGRIGDDTRSGNIVTIIRENRLIKARCL
jgi:hypothetical protein